ncbi:MAG: cation:proton antiporter, partial [Actinobacteria bacterium]|nr:cation:proton antiporter [Actinomycetota bacterium]
WSGRRRCACSSCPKTWATCCCWRPRAMLVLVVMPLVALLTGVAAHLLLGLPIALAALLGACLCPTDPIVASDVVSGGPAARDLPAKTRQVLTEESGANDGLALPLVLLALAPVLGKAAGGEAVTATYQVLVGAIVGALLGYVTARVVRSVEAHKDIGPPSDLVVTLVLAITVLGAARVLKSDGVLAVFVAGLAYNARGRQRRARAAGDARRRRQPLPRRPVHVLLGAVLPWDDWADLGWAGPGFALAVLAVRRPPPVLALARLLGLRLRDAVFVGWFGPIGVSAVFYLALSADEGATDPRLFAAGTLAVAASTLAHGVTALPARRAYARRAASP